jgi:hypothetical protein
VDGLAEEGGIEDAFGFAEDGKGRGGVFGRKDFDFEAVGSGRRDLGEFLEFFGIADDEEFGVVNVADGGAAFGFVHVVGGDEECHTAAGKFKEEIPKLAAGDGIDAGGGLVKEKDIRFVDEGTGECEALFPPAGQSPGKLGLPPPVAPVEAGESENVGHALFEAG